MTEKQAEVFFEGFKEGFEIGRRRALDEILYWLEVEANEVKYALEQAKKCKKEGTK